MSAQVPAHALVPCPGGAQIGGPPRPGDFDYVPRPPFATIEEQHAEMRKRLECPNCATLCDTRNGSPEHDPCMCDAACPVCYARKATP